MKAVFPPFAPGFVDEFVAAGFKPFNGLSLVLSAYAGGTRINSGLTVRKLRESSDWEAMLEQQVCIDHEDFGYLRDGGVFRRKQLNSLRAMAEEGHGDWWGAFQGDELVGGMGLYFDEARSVGRFQYVTTLKNHRRRRVCTTLLDSAVRHAFETVKVKELVIWTGADDDNPAIPTYRHFGFRDTVRTYALTRRD